jgi:hypothetical protein
MTTMCNFCGGTPCHLGCVYNEAVGIVRFVAGYDVRKREGELVEVVRLLMGSVEVFARDLASRGHSGSASILDSDLRRARAAIAKVEGGGG